MAGRDVNMAQEWNTYLPFCTIKLREVKKYVMGIFGFGFSISWRC